MSKLPPRQFAQRFVIRDGQFTCAYCGVAVTEGRVVHEPECRMVRPVVYWTANQSGGMAGHDLALVVSLKDLRLRHAPGSGCTCRGLAHEISVAIDPADHELHSDYDCTQPGPLDAGVLQALHEQAHPEGTAYAENCRERGCIDTHA